MILIVMCVILVICIDRCCWVFVLMSFFFSCCIKILSSWLVDFGFGRIVSVFFNVDFVFFSWSYS